MYKIPKRKAPLREKSAVRFTAQEYRKYQDYIQDIGICQVCEESYDLDAPHHTKQGNGNKDDRSLICICIACHREIHTKGYSDLKKTKLELLEIGEDNWLSYQQITV